MTAETVSLLVEGVAWTAWTRIVINYSATDAARVFALTASDDTTASWQWMPNSEVKVFAGGDMVLNGFLEVVNPSFDAAHHKIELSGRSRSADTIDSSAEHETGEFRDMTVLDIAKALDKQGVGFSTDQKLKKIPLFRVNSGETVFEALERACRHEHLVLQGQADGSIKITKGGKTRVNTPLIEGVNIKIGSATFDVSKKHSDYKIKGQRAIGKHLSGALTIERSSKDTNVKRYRPKHVHTETDTDEGRAQKRADRERDRQHGESIKAEITVVGWRDDNGRLWEANTLVFVYSPRLNLEQDLLIQSVSLSQDGTQGTIARLSLVHPKALDSDAPTGSKSNKAYAPGAVSIVPLPAPDPRK